MAHRHGLHGLLTRLVNRPLLASPAIARFYLGYLANRAELAGELIDAGAAPGQGATPLSQLTAFGRYEWRTDPSGTRAHQMVRNAPVAVITIEGSLVHKDGTMTPSSGMTGYDGIEYRLHQALADPAVKGILLDLHSHGGEVTGAFDLADKVYAARGIKPVWALADESALSAAYLLASQASRVIVPRTGHLGSVGVVAMHVDESAFLEKQGYKVTLIHAGEHKVDGNPFEALPAAVAERWRAEIGAVYDRFVAAVARGNGLSEAAVRATEAQVFTAEEALAAGFADAVMPASEAIDEFTEFVAGRGRAPGGSAAFAATPEAKEDPMAERNGSANSAAPQVESGAGGPTAEQIAAQLSAARAEGAAQERARIAAITTLAEPGEEQARDGLIADGSSVADAALKLAEGRRARKAARLAARAEDAPAPVRETPVDASQPAGPAGDAGATDDAALKAGWDRDADLRAEFGGSFARFAAYKKAEASGKVRILRKSA